MDKNYYAIGFQPQQVDYGQTFLYDGEHDFNYWKTLNSKANYSDYWGMRDTFVHNNRVIADQIKNYPIQNIANFMLKAPSEQRVRQTLGADSVWQSIKNIAEDTGTIVSFDTETIGDAQRTGRYKINGKLQSYDGYAGITEIGFDVRNFADGNALSSKNVTLAVGLNSNQIMTAKEALTEYRSSGFDALNENQQRMLSWFSKYGHSHYSQYFQVSELDFLNSQKFVTINVNAVMNEDAYDLNAIERGIVNWEKMSNDAHMKMYADKSHVLRASNTYLQSVIKDTTGTKALIAANVSYDASVLGHELDDIGVEFDAENMYSRTADLVYANESIAKANGTSVYALQASTGNEIMSTSNPASVQASNEAAGKTGSERHIAGPDSGDVSDDILNQNFVGGKAYYDHVLEANETNAKALGLDKEEYNRILDKQNAGKKLTLNDRLLLEQESQKIQLAPDDRYYVFTSGSLDKNSMDHAIVDGTETQSYSFRNRYLTIDEENSGYTKFTPQTPDGVEAEARDVYVLTMNDEQGNVIRKQFESEADKDRWILGNSMSISKEYSSQTTEQRIFQNDISDIDLARREYDRLMNATDVRVTEKGLDANGFAGMGKYLAIVDEIDANGGITKVTDDFLAKHDIKTSTQKRTFNKLYTRLESEKEALREVMGYINENMSDANNTQKTMALNKIMSAYKEELSSLGYKQGVLNAHPLILDDVLGIDIKVGESFSRINGSSVDTIQLGLSRIFKNASREEMTESFDELLSRGIISSNFKKLINSNAPRSSYYNTVFRDVAIQLSQVMQPLTEVGRNPFSFFEDVDKYKEAYNLSEQQVLKLIKKTTRNIGDEVLQHANSIYEDSVGNNITLSDIAKQNGMMTSSMKVKSNAIIESINNAGYVSGIGGQNKVLHGIAQELGYSEEQEKMLLSFFNAKDKDGAYRSYAINGRKDIQTFILSPAENGNAFMLLTNQAHSARINQILSDGISYETRKDLTDILGDHASVIELRRINKLDMGSFKKMGLPSEIAEVLGEDASLTYTTQGKSLQKFLLPEIETYEYNGKFNIEIRDAGDTLVSGFRKVGKNVLDYVAAGEFEKGTRSAFQNDNEYLKGMSSPAGVRAHKDANGNWVRSVNYNINDLSHAFQIDGSGLNEIAKFEVQKAVQLDDIDSPMYQLTKTIGVASGQIGETQILDLKTANSILSSNVWDEFFKKNLFVGTVSEDATFAENIAKLSTVGGDISRFDKSIFGLLMDTAKSDNYSSFFTKQAIDTLESFQKIVPYTYQVLSESNTKKGILTVAAPGYMRNLGAIDPSMRPTYTQVDNALNFDPREVNLSGLSGTRIGATGTTLIEDVINSNLNMTAPSGIPYGSQAHSITTPFKQMSDMELQLKYRELQGNIRSIAEAEGLEEVKLQYALDVFTDEHASLYEGKWFGAPMLHNQEPFMSSDVKKISMPQIANLEGKAQETTYAQLGDYIGKELKHGDVIGASAGKNIIWEGPSTIFTQGNYDDLIEYGETTIIPSERMVSDTKWFVGQEKGTVHFTLIDDIFMKNNPIFEGKREEALRYMQTIYDRVSGYDGLSDYRPMFIGNLEALKSSHSTHISVDSIYNTIVSEYADAHRLRQLSSALNRMEEFEGWKFKAKNGGLVSNQYNKSGMTNAINKLYDIILRNEDDYNMEYGLDKAVNNRIIDAIEHMQKQNIALVEARRMNVNEIMGSSVTMDERMQQAIRLRAIDSEDTYYVGEHEVEIDGVKTKVQAVDGVIDGKNGLIINGKGRTWHDLYLDELKSDISKGVYDKMDASEFSQYKGLKDFLEQVTADRQSGFSSQRNKLKSQERVIGGMKESVLFYSGKFDVDAHDVVRVKMDDLLKRLPDHGISSDDLQDLIFKTDGKPSRYLKQLTNGRVNNKSSLYIDFGTTIGGRKGALVPILNLSTTKEEIFFNRAQAPLVRFLNVYKENIGKVDGKKRINEAMETLYNSFARELSAFDKDSLLYKTMGKFVLPNSAQSLAQDEIAPILDVMMEDDDIVKSVRDERKYRLSISRGNRQDIGKLDELLNVRQQKLNEIAERIEQGDLDKSLYKLSGLSVNGKAERGFKTIYDSNGKAIKRYFTNTFETGISNLKRMGVDPGIIGLQLYNDYLKHGGKITSYETNKAFNKYISQVDIVGKLKEAGVKNVNKKNIMKSIDSYIIDVRTLNEATINNANRIKIDDTAALKKITDIFEETLGRQYLSDVGIMSREVWRYPIFGAQTMGRFYLNDTIRGNQIRANLPVTSTIVHVDHDGDAYASSIDTNGGGLKTLKEQKYLLKSYEDTLHVNNKLMADLIRKGEAFKSDNITSIELTRMGVLEAFDTENYDRAIQEWKTIEGIDLDADLTEGQRLSAAYSDTLRIAYEEFDATGNMINNPDVIKASLAARTRKENIGSVSTPNYKFRDTLMRIYKDSKYQDIDRNKAFNILQLMTGLSRDKLLDVTEQSSIDVKHIYDAVNIAETPKWVKGASLLFNKQSNRKASQAMSEEGLRMMLTAVNNATFKFKGNVNTFVDETVQEILSKSMETFRRELDEVNEGDKALAQLKLEFRALYEMKDLPDAIELQNDIIRKKAPFADELGKRLAELGEVTETDSVFGDLSKAYTKKYSDERLLINYDNVYFQSGGIAKHDSIQNSAWVLKDVYKDKVTLQRVDIDTLEPMKGQEYTKRITGNSYETINRKLHNLLDDTDGINKYAYTNSPAIRDRVLNDLSKNKFNKSINAILFNTGYEHRDAFNAFESFTKIGGEKLLHFGVHNYNFINQLLGKKATINKTRSLINDFAWARQQGIVKTESGVRALITDINNYIANHPEEYFGNKGLVTKDYDEIVKERLISEDLFGSEEMLTQIHAQRIKMVDFDNKKFQDNIDFLNTKSYDIIDAERMLTRAYDNLDEVNKALVESGVNVPEIEQALATRNQTIDGILGDINANNRSVINQVQSETYALFKDTSQMDIKFQWNVPRANSMVGFGEYFGTHFSDLTQADVDRILKTDISDKALRTLDTKQAYATRKTVELLQEYSTAKAFKKTGSVLDNRAKYSEVNNVIDRLKATVDSAPESASETIEKARKAAKNSMKKQTLSGNFMEKGKQIFDKIPKRTVGIAVGAMAALGVANNLLHNQKNQSPLTPARRPNGNGSPDINGNYPESSGGATAAPMSPKRTVYHDKGSGFNFKVSAKTKNYIDDRNNAKLIGMANGGQASVYSQADMSGVTDNWLANKFAELTV